MIRIVSGTTEVCLAPAIAILDCFRHAGPCTPCSTFKIKHHLLGISLIKIVGPSRAIKAERRLIFKLYFVVCKCTADYSNEQTTDKYLLIEHISPNIIIDPTISIIFFPPNKII